jgi:CubicO group peptidase (beta-lactamase class C family)
MALAPLPTQPAGTPWPTDDWPTAPLPHSVDTHRLNGLLDRAFDGLSGLGEAQAVVIIQAGRLILERYAPGFGPEATCASWSMAKSITQALAGILVGDGRLDVEAPADVPEWREPGDPRGAITLDHLFHMSSGLDFLEAYHPDKPSDVIEMLWGSGKDDTAAYAAAKPLAHPPGAFFYYSSGTTNIISRCLARALGASGAGFEAFMRQRLFDPIGMKSPVPKFDAAGTFIGSSFCYATPQDFARFGLLYLRNGLWDGRRILPERWVDYARTPTFQQRGCPDGPYGAHWWLDFAGPGTFSANGHDGQHIVIRPDRDLIVVRNGVRPEAAELPLKAWFGDVVELFA